MLTSLKAPEWAFADSAGIGFQWRSWFFFSSAFFPSRVQRLFISKWRFEAKFKCIWWKKTTFFAQIILFWALHNDCHCVLSGRSFLGAGQRYSCLCPCRLSQWEIEQKDWQRTLESLEYHQGLFNQGPTEWFADVNFDDEIHVMLLCGSDVLESFSVPGLWSESQVEITDEVTHLRYFHTKNPCLQFPIRIFSGCPIRGVS